MAGSKAKTKAEEPVVVERITRMGNELTHFVLTPEGEEVVVTAKLPMPKPAAPPDIDSGAPDEPEDGEG